MKTLRDLLRDADPLRYETPWTASERSAVRRAIVSAPRAAGHTSRQRVALAVVVTLALVATAAGGSFWSRASVGAQAPVRFEVRLAEDNQTGTLREVVIAQSNRRIYLHEDVVVANADIAGARVLQSDDGSRFSVAVALSAEGAAKMLRATQNHVGRPLAILVEGEVVLAPTLRGPISASAVIDGRFTKAEADRIASGLLGR